MERSSRFKGCIIGGAIGDALGSGYENLQEEKDDDVFYLFGKPPPKEPAWKITDDTQLIITTCEFLINDASVDPAHLAKCMVENYKKGLITNVGSSTLKALKELEMGGHWSQVGRKGEYAAGNGAAMRIAPFAFKQNINREKIRDICSITHHNDEAYVGAYNIVKAIQIIIAGGWSPGDDIRAAVIDCIQDTRIRDRLIECVKHKLGLEAVGKQGNNGYVVNTIPLVLTAFNQISSVSPKEIYDRLIEIGGDTDTNCSLFGQLAGAYLGYDGLPLEYKRKLEALPSYDWISRTIDRFIKNEKWPYPPGSFTQ